MTWRSIFAGMRRPVPVLAVLLTSLCVILWSVWLDVKQVERDFREETERIDRLFTQRISNLETVLVSLAGLYHASDELNLAELTGFTEELLRAYPFIHRILHLQKISEPERHGFEQAMLEQGLVGFRVREYAPEPGGPLPARHKHHLVVDFLEPLDPLAAGLLGYDMASHPGAAPALDQATSSGGLVATAKLRLKQPHAPAHYVFKPVYLGRYPPHSPAERREMLSGVVALEIHAERFMTQSDTRPGFVVSIRQQSAEPAPASFSNDGFRRSDPTLQQGHNGSWLLSSELHLNAYGQALALAVSRQVTLDDVNLLRLAFSWLGMMAVLGFVVALYTGRRNAQREAYAAAQAVAAEGERFSQVVDNAFDAVITSDQQGRIVSWNRMATYMFGYAEEDVSGKPLFPLILTADQTAEYEQKLASFFAPENHARTSKHLETQGRDRSGRVFPLELALSKAMVNGELLLSVFARDITERKESDQQIRQLAYYDNLTQLPNRQLFKEQTEQAVAAAARHQRTGAVLFLDLDGFKRINDTLGHDLGDLLLIGVAERLQEQVRSCDRVTCSVTEDEDWEERTIARLGGDEFTVLLAEVRDPISVTIVARRIQAAISSPFTLDGHEVYVTPSIGIALFPQDGSNVDQILKNADTAMYHAKAIGKNNFQFYAEDMNSRASNRLRLEGDLRKALERGELHLAYQPQIDVGQGNIVAAEALLRWQHPELGNIPPYEFIPLAEETGMIIDIGEWVLNETCRQNKAWQDAGLGPIRVAVNLSPVQFVQRDLIDKVRQALVASGLQPQYLELEITEGILMRNVEETIATLTEFTSMGVGLSVDDFGTGYSSLSYLKRFPLDSLKIDRSFVRDIPNDADDLAITAAIIAMGHQLKLQIVAEGVETAGQLEFLQEQGCEMAQGYLISRPLASAQLEKMLLGQKSVAGVKRLA